MGPVPTQTTTGSTTREQDSNKGTTAPREQNTNEPNHPGAGKQGATGGAKGANPEAGQPGPTLRENNQEQRREAEGGRTSVKRLVCLSTNINSLPNKTNEFKVIVQMTKPDLIAVTEVKPTNSRFELICTDYHLDGYNAFTKKLTLRTDCDKETRGIIAWVHADLNASEINMGEDFQESLWLQIRINRESTLTFGCIYRSPNSSPENSLKLNSLLKVSNENNPSHLLIVGDFNQPKIDWVQHTASSHLAMEFLQACDDALLFQHVTKPTRVRSSQTPSVLDLIFTNEENMVTNVEHLSGIGKSDHASLLFHFVCDVERNLQGREIVLYRKANIADINTQLRNIDWEQEIGQTNTTHDKYEVLLQHCRDIESRYIPRKTFKVGGKRMAPGISNTEAQLLCKKHRAWTRLMETRTQEKQNEYAKLRNKVKTVTKGAAKKYEQEIALKAKEEPKRFWNLVKSKTKVKEKIPDLKMGNQQNAKTSTEKEKAEVLNSFFATTFTTEPAGDLPVHEPVERPVVLENLEITDAQVRDRLSRLDPRKSMGPDKMHPFILKEAAASLAHHLE